MHIITKDVRDLTPLEYRACLRNNLGDGGYMHTELRHAREGQYQYDGTKAIMMWRDHDHDACGKLIAWALLTPTKLDGLTGVTPYIKRNSKYTAQLWVKCRYRNRGHGTTLMKHIKRYYDPRPHVIPHDDASSELFSKFNVRVLGEDRFYLKKKDKIA